MRDKTRATASSYGWRYAILALLIAAAALCFGSQLVARAAYAAEPFQSRNADAQSYGRWASPVTSYVAETASGDIMRVECNDNATVHIEEYDADGGMVSSRTLDVAQLAPVAYGSNQQVLWGGFFAGSDSYYTVVGRTNPTESDDAAILRVTKLDANWNVQLAVDLKGINTRTPFDAGSLRMLELDGMLYIRTAHTMYTSSDGLNHQSNMTFIINEATMEPVDGFWSVGNIGVSMGYVSHSFNQFLTELNGSVYALDHGDAYPRAVSIKRLGGSYTEVLSIAGETGDNTTGVTLGGFAASDTAGTLLAVGTSVDQGAAASSGFSGKPSNVWLSVTPSSLGASKVIWLTDYTDRQASTPTLTEVDENTFMVAWNNVGTYGYADGTFTYLFVDGTGAALCDPMTGNGYVSDCQPIVHDGSVTWYATGSGSGDWGPTDSSAPTFYLVNTDTYRLTSVSTAPSDFGFPDVTPGDWYATNEVLGYALNHGLMNGYSDGRFGPYDSITRAQVACILHNMAGNPQASSASFADVDYDAYYGDAVRWARATGVVSGYGNNTFAPDRPVSRQELCAMLANYAKLVGAITVASDCTALDAIAGSDQVADWARTSVGWCVDQGIISGEVTGGVAYVNPDGSAWRCAAAKMVGVLHRDVLNLG